MHSHCKWDNKNINIMMSFIALIIVFVYNILNSGLINYTFLNASQFYGQYYWISLYYNLLIFFFGMAEHRDSLKGDTKIDDVRN